MRKYRRFLNKTIFLLLIFIITEADWNLDAGDMDIKVKNI